MEFSINEYLKNRIKASKKNSLKKQLVLDGKEYQKKWAKAVQFFQKRINIERKKENLPELPFIVIRQKLEGLKEIDDLRWFYTQCLIYERKKKSNTFSKIFFGATKIR